MHIPVSEVITVNSDEKETEAAVVNGSEIFSVAMSQIS